jgi:hypothetical protein
MFESLDAANCFSEHGESRDSMARAAASSSVGTIVGICEF